MTRTTLTKSLHTVTAVANLATYLYKTDPAMLTSNAAVCAALEILGQPYDWSHTDETFAKCVKAVDKARSAK